MMSQFDLETQTASKIISKLFEHITMITRICMQISVFIMVGESVELNFIIIEKKHRRITVSSVYTL